ncbi:putative phage abortive infection protein [Acinetobacter sp. F16]|uniref:putative phage abortive infection protein n=1 Tax=Acinetobacter sp. F16 TaxID=3462438 RepID=UPI004046E588
MIYKIKNGILNFFKTIYLDRVYLFFIILIIIFCFLVIYYYFGRDILYIIKKASDYEDFMTNRDINILKNDVITTANQADNYIVHLGYIGDYLTGTVGLSISIITVFLVFITFYNEKRKIERQRFEDHLFHLLKNQKSNLTQMKIEKRISSQHSDLKLKQGDYVSEKAVLQIFREFFKIREKVKLSNVGLNNIEIIKVSYIFLYYGLGERSFNIVENLLDDDGKLDKKQQARLFDIFTDGKIKNKVREKYALNKDIKLSSLEQEIKKITENNLYRKEISEYLNYPAVGGHQTRLDHYFANLLFCFDLINEQKKYMLEDDLKIYKKELMSQLNVYEKILLLIHSTSPMGEDFQNYVLEYDIKGYIPKGMIKEEEFNISSYFAELENKYRTK